ncbi:MAG: hypothetical protein HDS97_00050 [Bacteroidales bacterium]|nr:hypothetical protein [Bacteroidales bacterium]
MNPIESLILRRIRRLLILIFPVSIFVDLISGFCTVQLHTYIPICQLLRILIMARVLFLLKKRVNFILIWVVLMPILFFILASPLWIIICGIEPYNGYNPGMEIESFSKIFYCFIIIAFFIVYRTEIQKQYPLRIISNYGLLIAMAVIISFVTGYGNHTYGGNYGFGTKSYFKAGNDLGLTILYASVASSLYIFSHFGWKRVLITLTISLSAILVGTRVAQLGIALWVTILMYYIVFIYRPADSSMRKRLRFYKPLIILSYILCIVSAIKFLLSVFDSYMLTKYTADAMMSARSLLTAPAEEYISNLEWFEIAFGRGVSSIYYHVAQSIGTHSTYRMVEADLHELLGGYGLIGFLVLFFPFVYFMIKAIKRYSSQPDFTLFAVIFITASFLIFAYVAGHCFRNTMAAPIYGYIVSLMYYEKKRSLDK